LSVTESTSSSRHAVEDPPGRPRASNGAGSAALVLGAVALVGAFFRVVNLGSVVLGGVGLVLGVTGWRLAGQGRATNRAQAVTGAALSAVAVVASIAVMVARGPLGGSGPERGARSTQPATTAPPDSGPSQAAGVPLPPLDEDPVTENQPGFVAQSYAGHGDQVVRLRSPLADVAIAVIAYRGRGSFTVDTESGTGGGAESLVSTVGNWQGTTLVNVQNFTNQPVASLRIRADQGQWTVALRPLAAARRWDGSGPVSGRGADVLLARAAFTGESTISAVHRGAAGFTVSGYGGTAALAGSLLNGFGDFTGTATVPAGTVVLAIEADGTWTMSKR
jgi:hypothetical protein